MRLKLICVINSKSFHNNKWCKKNNFPSSDTMPINTFRCHNAQVAGTCWDAPPPPNIGFLSTSKCASRYALIFRYGAILIKASATHREPFKGCQGLGRNAPDQYQATSYEGTKLMPGLHLHLSAVSFFLRPQLWNGTCEVALISKAVASPFSYRYKKIYISEFWKKKRCEQATSGFALQNLAYIGNWIFDRRGAFMWRMYACCGEGLMCWKQNRGFTTTPFMWSFRWKKIIKQEITKAAASTGNCRPARNVWLNSPDEYLNN